MRYIDAWITCELCDEEIHGYGEEAYYGQIERKAKQAGWKVTRAIPTDPRHYCQKCVEANARSWGLSN